MNHQANSDSQSWIATWVGNNVSTLLLLLSTFAAPSVSQADWWSTASKPHVRFDVRPIAIARPIDASPNLQIDVMVSAMAPTLDPQAMEQWDIQITPRNEFVQIADYAPRTQLASELAGPIDVKSTNEQSKSFGMTAVGNYGPAHADAGLDQGSKSIHSTSFQKVAPMRAVIASGTVDRGRGVFFKLRAAEQQVLEGEKQFGITLSVPATWRADLLDVKIKGERKTRPFGAFSDEIEIVGEAHFVVATYRKGDTEAGTWARNLAASEDNLRDSANRFRERKPSRDPVTGMFHRFADKLDINDSTSYSVSSGDSWVGRLLMGQTNPYTDETIKKLPVDLRVVAIDYCDHVRQLSDLQSHPMVNAIEASRQYVSAKVPVTQP